MHLTIMRHAKAIDRQDWHGPDADRPLLDERMDSVEEWCWRLGPALRADLILSSPWERAWHTAVIAGRCWGVPVQRVPWLAGEALDPAQAAAALHAHRGADVVVVGHEPGLSRLCHWLCGAELLLKKGGVVVLSGDLRANGCQLRQCVSMGFVERLG